MAKVTVMEYERVVRFVDGRLAGVFGPGRHAYRWRGTRLERVDLRPRLVAVTGQEMLTADRLVVKISATLRLAVADPALFVTSAQDPLQELYLRTQVELRTAAGEADLEALLAARSQLPSRLTGALAEAARGYGVDVLEVTVRDVMLPGELRRAYADTALAKERGRAELERARAEAAALRSLANTAKLLEDHPALLRLRALQTAGQTGTTLVLHAD
ncbi:slipin family protein [Dactylosporangium sp. NPDC049742]|uniref:slipin family protein n=1 Tax=Dactylosporangium sp. NPDC049742 TaxID=3154737 RepID=UPI00343FA1F4